MDLNKIAQEGFFHIKYYYEVANEAIGIAHLCRICPVKSFDAHAAWYPNHWSNPLSVQDD